MERKVWGQVEENRDRLELEIRDMKDRIHQMLESQTVSDRTVKAMAFQLHTRLRDARKTKRRLFDYLSFTSFTSGEAYAVAGSVGGKR